MSELIATIELDCHTYIHHECTGQLVILAIRGDQCRVLELINTPEREREGECRENSAGYAHYGHEICMPIRRHNLWAIRVGKEKDREKGMCRGETPLPGTKTNL